MKVRILIVEDEALTALALQKQLENLGHEVCGLTASGEEALVLAASFRPDLVLMDIQLSGAMTGIEAAEQIRNAFSLPVVYLTAHADEKLLEQVKKTYPYGFLLKPFDERTLRIGLHMAMHQRATERRATESEELFRLVTESIDDIFWLTSPDLDSLYYVSPAYENLWGRSRESLYLQPKSFLEAIHHKDRSRVESVLLQPLKEARELEYRLIRPDDSVRWVRDRRFAVNDGQGCCFRVAGIVTDITGQRQSREELLVLNDKLHHQANHDMLTGLPNRRLCIDRLKQALAHARRFGGKVGMLFIDLDGFKGINDRFGHQAGDQVLKLMAGRIRETLREVDSAARLGGDEFGVVLTGLTHVEDAEQVARKIVERIEKAFTLGGRPWTLSASIGVAVFPVHGQTPDQLISRADKAMYQIKKSGKRGVGLCPDSVAGVAP